MTRSIVREPTVSATRSKPPLMSLSQDGHLYVANLMHLFQCSHQTIYTRIRSGAYPAPDGRDGRRPFWNTATILPFFRSNGRTK
jgi:hypothetical protein